jgi:tRNA 5-methylaminomethyl-2-thiouridine biosynthesis bifunctional protein
LAWQHQRQWHVLQTGLDLGQQFLTTWRDWQQTPARPDRLFFTVITDQPLPAHDALTALSLGSELQALQQALAAAWRGMTPGTHRLVFADGQVHLTVHSGPADKSLRELDVVADRVLLGADFFDTAPATDPTSPPAASALQRLQAIARVCRPGTRVGMARNHATGDTAIPVPGCASDNTLDHPPDDTHTSVLPDASPRALPDMPPREAWRQCGFELSPAHAEPEAGSPSLWATFAPTWTPRSRLRQNPLPASRQVLVIGAGLSGSAVAHSLAVRGWAVTVLDQGDAPGAGASGLPAGLAAPHVSPDDSVLSRITRAGVRATLQRARTLLHSGTDWAPTGVLEHRVEGKRSLPTGNAWPASGHEWSTQATAAHIAAAGLPPESPALWHGLAGWIRPRQLAAAQLQTPGVEVRWGQTVQTLERRGELWTALGAQGQVLAQAPLLVVASAFDSLALLRPLPGVAVPLNPLRGQISFGHLHALSDTQRQLLPPFPVNGHGSFISGVSTPDGPPGWYIGSTFERNCLQAPVRPEDHAANRLRLATLLPALGAAMAPQFEPQQVHGWAGLRCTLPDRLPAVGPIDPARWPGLWLCAGMGARGISLAVLCGELAAAWLENEPLPLAPALAKHLAAQRFASA